MSNLYVDLGSYEVIRGEVAVESDKCKGCRFCVEFCPEQVLALSVEFNAKGYHFPALVTSRADLCTACGFCEYVCPDFAIFVKEKKRSLTYADISTRHRSSRVSSHE